MLDGELWLGIFTYFKKSNTTNNKQSGERSESYWGGKEIGIMFIDWNK